MSTEDHNWHRCALIHDSFWLIPLPKIARLAYFYFSTYCQNREWPISLTIMAKTLHVDTKRLKREVDTLIAFKLIKKTVHKKGRACAYQCTLRTAQGWGQTPLAVGSNAPTHLGSNAPSTKGQTPLLTTPLDIKSHPDSDTSLLSLFIAHFRKWTFNRKPIGRFIMSRKMQSQALEMLRYLNGQPGFSTTEFFTEFFDHAREYLALPRDVLSPNRDLRALSPRRWLDDWQEQVSFATTYQNEKRRNVIRLPREEES